MIIKFEDIKPNPYRDLVRNPLREDTIERLRLSVRSTGFWNNISVRKNKSGEYELHSGHHRLEAAKREGLTEADFRIKDIDDAGMVKVKHNEDSARRTFDAATMIESVRAVVNALAKGEIPPFKISSDTPKRHIRYAPSFVPTEDVGPTAAKVAYTALSIAEFLDETKNRPEGGKKANDSVVTALNALALIEQQELSEASLKDIPLDNPSGDTKQMGLIQKVRLKKAQIEIRQDLTKAQQERAAVDAKRREDEAKEKASRAELLRRESEAQAEHNAKKLREVAELRKQEEARAEERKIAFNETRAKLDAQLEEAKAREQASRHHDKTLPVRHAVSACLFKLKTITSERFSFREELKALAREKALTQAERENIRQGLLAVATWYEEAAIAFRPVVTVDVLAEAKQREEFKQKRAHNNE